MELAIKVWIEFLKLFWGCFDRLLNTAHHYKYLTLSLSFPNGLKSEEQMSYDHLTINTRVRF
jgi:hypothetical protein